MIRPAMGRTLVASALLVSWAGSHTLAQAPVPGASKEPIEIVADLLTVEQARQVAIFSGNVQAIQGEMTLTADRLAVFYAEGAGADAAPAGVGQGTQITRIEAEGNVKVATPRDTAAGDRGVYDVAAQTIRLEGNVVLTSGSNVVRGVELDVDLQRNVSTVRGGAGGAAQRVRALFVPSSDGS
jgi:lipopolysaccharide export system protein LptA